MVVFSDGPVARTSRFATGVQHSSVTVEAFAVDELVIGSANCMEQRTARARSVTTNTMASASLNIQPGLQSFACGHILTLVGKTVLTSYIAKIQTTSGEWIRAMVFDSQYSCFKKLP